MVAADPRARLRDAAAAASAAQARPVRILDAAALTVLVAQIVLRLTVRTEGSQWGTSLLVSLLVFAAAGTWSAARALEGRLDWRFTGFEAPLAGLWLLSLLSIPRASFPLAALDGSLRLGSLALLLPVAVHMIGTSRRSILFSFMNAALLAISLFGLVQYFWLFPSMQESDEVHRHIEAQGDLAPELRGRLEAREPSGTLFYPNTFAGFLVLTIPFAVGFALDGRSRRRAVGILAATAGVVCLALTGSNGGIVAGIAAALAFAILSAAQKFPGARRGLAVASGVAALAGVALVAAGPLSPDRLGRRIETIAVRDVYWDAAARMAGDHPVLGVGINHFGEYYPQYKDDRQEESNQAHNDYLQVLAELGIPGLLCFVAVLAVSARRALDPETEFPPPAPPDRAADLVSIAIPIGLLAAYGLQGSGESLGLVALLAVAWIAAFRSGTQTASGVARWTRIGLAAGLAGAAVHFLVDFDFYDPSFAEAFILSLAGLTLLSRAPEPWTLGTPASALAGVACFLLALPTFAAFVPRYLAAEAASDEGREALFEARRAESEGRGNDARSQCELAADRWEAASLENGLDPVPSLQLGILRFETWRHAVDGGLHEVGSIEEQTLFEAARGALENARRVRKRWGAPAFWLAELRLRSGRQLAHRARSGSAGPETGAYAVHQLAAAEQSAQEAVRLYPTRAENRYLLGRALEANARADEAAGEYREALRLSDLAVRVPRLALDPYQRAWCLLKSGGSPEEARRLLTAHLASLLPPGRSADERSEAARRIAMNWKRDADDAMDALIDHALETVAAK